MIKTVLLLTALALVQARPDAEPTNSRIYEFHPDCPPAEVHYLLPHEYDCTKFYYCEYGLKWIEPRDCAPGTEFNAEIQVCVHPANSGCHLPGYSSTAGPTAAPTTAAPATAAPTTAAPATAAPTTAAPATAAPTTSAPSTAAPTTAAPPATAEPPATAAPTTAAPATAAPTTAAPATAAPTTSAPATAAPSTAAPATAAPTTAAPATAAPTTAAPVDCETLDNGCPADFSVHKLIPHEEYCHKFYYCDNGELVPKYCPQGTYFNPELEICDWPFNVDCVNDGSYEYPSTAAPAPTTPGGNDIGDVLDNGCPADFSVNHLLPHETECNKFYYCVFGQKVETACAPGTHFNFEIQACDWPENVDCVSSGNPSTAAPVPDSSEEIPNPSDPVDPEDPWVPLPNGCPADFDVHHLLPHESDCGKFYYCVHGKTVEAACPPGLHFSPSSQTCDWPQYAGCENWDNGGCPSPNPDGGCTSTAAPATEGSTTVAPVNPPITATEAPTTVAPVNPPITATQAPTTVAPATPTVPATEAPTTVAPVNPPITATQAPTTVAPVNPPITATEAPTTVAPATPTNPATEGTTLAPVNPPITATQAPTTVAPATPTNPATEGTTLAPVPDSSEEIPNPDDPVDPQDPWVPLPNGCPADFDVHHLVPHESDCGKFYYCVYGKLVEADCPAGLHFSPSTQTCDWPQYAGCEHWDNGGCPSPNPDGGCTSTAAPATEGTTTVAPVNPPITATQAPTTVAPATPTVPATEGTTLAPVNPPITATQAPTTVAPVNPPITVTQAPTTAAPGDGCDGSCPINPADKCKNECNVAPWAHDDCDKFWICNGDQPLLITCSEGLHFNPNTYSCDFNCNVGCVRNSVQATPGYDGVKVFLPWNQIDENMMKVLKIEL